MTERERECASGWACTSVWGAQIRGCRPACSALSDRVTVEMWSAGRGFGQDLVGIRPFSDPRVFESPGGSGTKVALAFDPTHVGPDFVLPTDLENLDVHGPHCSAPIGSGYVLFRDLRHGSAGREVMHR
ncbi:hypothetical protein [Streptomyces sp. NPDC014806]|uniref:hypothetical protein n=1 Tax=Streptomyces sp. NPDC014806 TaxID=3364920 RepID=UPI0037013BCE